MRPRHAASTGAGDPWLLQGIPTYGRDVDAELVTPTGAAIITTLADGFGQAPSMTVERIGYAAGSRDLSLPNLLRVSIATHTILNEGYDEDTVMVIETNVDDMNLLDKFLST